MDAGSKDIAWQVEDLQHHERELRSLVRALLRGSDDVDDVVQETWLRAIGRPPREKSSAGAFLRQVARRVVIDRHRAERARERREEAAARRVGSEPSAAETVERLQACALVSQAVAELPVGLRDAVVLRHVQGLDVAAVATRLGISGDAVRQRVHRGLQELRRRLAPEFARGDRANRSAQALWAVAAWPAAHESVPVLTILGVAMSKAGLSLSLAAVLLCGLLLWWWNGSPRMAPADRAETAALAARRADTELAERAVPEAAPRQTVAATEASAASTGYRTAPRDIGLRARIQVVDADSGMAIPHAEVAVMWGAFDWYALDAATKARVRQTGSDQHRMLQAFGTTEHADADGILELPIARELLLSCVEGSRAGELTLYANQLVPGRTVRLPLHVDSGFAVRVVEADNAAPVSGVQIRLWPVWDDGSRRASPAEYHADRGLTDSEGLCQVSAIRHTLRAWTDQFGARPDALLVAAEVVGLELAARAHRLELDDLPATPLTLTVPGQRGSVVVRCLRADGRPVGDGEDVELRPLGIPGAAAIRGEPLGSGMARFDHVASTGRFEVRNRTLMADSEASQEIDGPPPGGTREITLVHDTGAVSLVGRFVDSDGRPLPYTQAWLRDPELRDWQQSRLASSEDARFRLELDEWAIGLEFRGISFQQVSNHANGLRLGQARDLGVLTRGIHDLGDVPMQPMPELATVRITVDGAAPTLLPSLGIERFDAEDGGWVRMGLGDPFHTEVVRADHFVIHGVDDGRPLRVRVQANDCLPAEPVEIARLGAALHVDLQRGAALELAVRTPEALRSELRARLFAEPTGDRLTESFRSDLSEVPTWNWHGIGNGAYRLEVYLVGNAQPLQTRAVTLDGLSNAAVERVEIDLGQLLREIVVDLRLPDGSPCIGIPGAAARIGSAEPQQDDELVSVTRGTARLWTRRDAREQTAAAFVPGFEPAVAALPPAGEDRISLTLRPLPTARLRLPEDLRDRDDLQIRVVRQEPYRPFVHVDGSWTPIQRLFVPREQAIHFDADGHADVPVLDGEILEVQMLDTSQSIEARPGATILLR